MAKLSESLPSALLAVPLAVMRSLAVYPAAGLIRYYRGKRLTLINKTPTPYDRQANLVIAGPIGEILGAVRVGEI